MIESTRFIRGSGCNNDGRGDGTDVTAARAVNLASSTPHMKTQASRPQPSSYFEAHGTGTAIGDPVEVKALGRFLGEAGVTKDAPAFIGSVKSNIGHAMAAAGIAGLIKAIKVIENRTAPPHAGFESPHPALNIDSVPLEIPTEARELNMRGDAPLRVGVSSFGFGGTNSHIVLEEPPRRDRARAVSLSVSVSDSVEESERPLPEAVLVTAPNVELLGQFLGNLADWIESGPGQKSSLADIAFTLNARRRHERVRAGDRCKGREPPAGKPEGRPESRR